MRRYGALCAALAVLMLGACTATQPPAAVTTDTPGLLLGLWHGFIAPVAFIVSIFTDVRIYAYPNTGVWYDLGFMIGISGFSGGLFASRRSRTRN